MHQLRRAVQRTGSFPALPAPCRNASQGHHTHLFLIASDKHALQGCPTSVLAPSCGARHPATRFARRAAPQRVPLPPLPRSTQNTAKPCRHSPEIPLCPHMSPWSCSSISAPLITCRAATPEAQGRDWNTKAAQLGTSPPSPAQLEAAMGPE